MADKAQMRQISEISFEDIGFQANCTYGDVVRTLEACNKLLLIIDSRTLLEDAQVRADARGKLFGIIKDSSDAAIALLVLDKDLRERQAEDDRKEAR